MGRLGKRRVAKSRLQKADDLMRQQKATFHRKFGRDPGPDDPVFFDPDKDEPTPLDLEQAFADLPNQMRLAGIRPELIYAYEKTGLILMEGEEYPESIKDEYQAAMREYFALEKAGKLPKK